jgi:hypothetical protein
VKLSPPEVAIPFLPKPCFSYTLALWSDLSFSDRRNHMTTHQDYKLALQAFQSQRLRRDLADLAAEAQYQQIGQFFFDEMYGSRDFSARDDQAQRAHWFVHRVPGVTAHDVESVLALLELTNKLDDEIADGLIALGAPLDFDEAIYERAYRRADHYASACGKSIW